MCNIQSYFNCTNYKYVNQISVSQSLNHLLIQIQQENVGVQYLIYIFAILCNKSCFIMHNGILQKLNSGKNTAIRHFSELAKFSANCHLAHDWTCFVKHKL